MLVLSLLHPGSEATATVSPTRRLYEQCPLASVWRQVSSGKKKDKAFKLHVIPLVYLPHLRLPPTPEAVGAHEPEPSLESAWREEGVAFPALVTWPGRPTTLRSRRLAQAAVCAGSAHVGGRGGRVPGRGGPGVCRQAGASKGPHRGGL